LFSHSESIFASTAKDTKDAKESPVQPIPSPKPCAIRTTAKITSNAGKLSDLNQSLTSFAVHQNGKNPKPAVAGFGLPTHG
jgi:hypothetical protein